VNHNHLRHQCSIGSLFGSNSSAALVTRHSPKATRCRIHSLVTDHLSHKKKNPLQAAGNFWSASPEASHTSTSEAYTQKNIRFRFCIQCANSPECLRLYFPTLKPAGQDRVGKEGIRHVLSRLASIICTCGATWKKCLKRLVFRNIVTLHLGVGVYILPQVKD
jgi:hypothetical protein